MVSSNGIGVYLNLAPVTKKNRLSYGNNLFMTVKANKSDFFFFDSDHNDLFDRKEISLQVET